MPLTHSSELLYINIKKLCIKQFREANHPLVSRSVATMPLLTVIRNRILTVPYYSKVACQRGRPFHIQVVCTLSKHGYLTKVIKPVVCVPKLISTDKKSLQVTLLYSKPNKC